jgi:hypothetical protein
MENEKEVVRIRFNFWLIPRFVGVLNGQLMEMKNILENRICLYSVCLRGKHHVDPDQIVAVCQQLRQLMRCKPCLNALGIFSVNDDFYHDASSYII